MDLHIADRIIEFFHISNPNDRTIELNAIEFQSCIQCRTELIRLGRDAVRFIGFYDRIGLRCERFCNGFEG